MITLLLNNYYRGKNFSQRENKNYRRHRRHRREKIWLDYWQIIIIAGKTIPGGKIKITAGTAGKKYDYTIAK